MGLKMVLFSSRLLFVLTGILLSPFFLIGFVFQQSKIMFQAGQGLSEKFFSGEL